MKILLDPIYSTLPSRCSCAAKCNKLVDKYLNEMGRSDVFFYWLTPIGWADQDKDWFPKHPNIRYIEIPYFKDRLREYAKFTTELDDVYAFNGSLWDIDAVWTARTSQTPLMRAVMTSPRARKHGRALKRIIIDEQMFMLQFRPSVALSDTEAQELLTLLGYLSADHVLINTETERREVMQVARTYLAPAQIKKISERLALISPVMFNDFGLKKEEFKFKRKERSMRLSFTGRLEKSANLEVVWDVMSKQFIMRGAKLELFICTVTPEDINAPPDFVQIIRPNRHEFWKMAKEKMDLMLWLHNSAEFSLSLIEPLLLGVPVILIDQQWVRDLLGDDYPFMVKGMTQAYAYVNKFYYHYDEMYAKWAKWHDEVMVPMFSPGGRFGTLMYDYAYDVLTKFEADQKAYVLEKYATKSDNEVINQIMDFVKDRQSFVLFDVIKEMGIFDVLERKTLEKDRDTRRITFSTDWNDMRMIFKHFHGWNDGLQTGEFVR